MKLSNRFDFFFNFPILLVAVVATALLFVDLFRSDKTAQGSSIGSVVRTDRYVRYKHKGEFVWKDMQPNQPVLQGDHVITGPTSQALVALNDGRKVLVPPGSSMIFESLDKSVQISNEKNQILESEETKNHSSHLLTPENFADVVVREDGDSEESTVSFQWKTEGRVNPKYLEYSSSRLFQKAEGREIETNGVNHARLRLGAGRYFWRLEDSEHQPCSATYEFNLRAVRPIQTLSPVGKVYSWDNAIEFRWSNPGLYDLPESHWIEVSSDRQFGQLLQKQAIPIHSLHHQMNFPLEGKFFWRISSRFGDLTIFSEPKEMQIEKGKKISIRLLEPRDKAPIASDSGMTFHWESNGPPMKYRWELSPKTKPNEIDSIETREQAYFIASPNLGEFRWRVRADLGTIAAESEWREFSVIKPGSLKTTAPPSGANIEIPSIGAPISFSFSKSQSNRFDHYLFQISNSPDFQSILGEKISKTNAFSTSEFNLSSDKDYFWRVISQSSEGLSLEMSSSSSFRVTIKSGPSAPRDLTPQSGVTCNPVKNKGLCRFAWMAVFEVDHFDVEFAKADLNLREPASDAFQKPVLIRRTKQTYLEESSLNEGVYYWRVRAVDSKNRVGEYSQINTVKITFGSAISAPRAHSSEVQ